MRNNAPAAAATAGQDRSISPVFATTGGSSPNKVIRGQWSFFTLGGESVVTTCALRRREWVSQATWSLLAFSSAPLKHDRRLTGCHCEEAEGAEISASFINRLLFALCVC